MRKTTQTVGYTVEGPNEAGKYKVTLPNGNSIGWIPPDSYVAGSRAAVQQHIASAPQVVEFEGYLIAPHRYGGSYGVWKIDDRRMAEDGSWGLVSADTSQEAYRRIGEYAGNPETRPYIAPMLALAHFFEKGLHND